MTLLQIAFIFTVWSIINCFQWAAAILAWQTGRSFWRWYWISQFLPIISMVILVVLWDEEEVSKLPTEWQPTRQN